MRTAIALTIHVSLAAFCLAEQPPSAATGSSKWTTTYQSGEQATQTGKHDEAAVWFLSSWSNAERDSERAASAISLGQTYRHLGRTRDAVEWFERSMKLWSTTQESSFMYAASVLNLADLERTAGEYAGSERVLRDALGSSILDNGYAAMVRNSLGDLLREQGRTTEARPLFEQTASDPKIASRDRATALIGLGDIERQTRSFDSSISHWNEALALTRADQDRTTEAIELRGLALTYLAAGLPARAEPLLRRSLDFMQRDPQMPGEQLATVHSGLAQLYRVQNKLAMAEEEWSRALEYERKSVGEQHPQVAWLMEMLSDVYSARGEFAIAQDYANRASAIMAAAFGDDSLAVASALTNRAVVEERSRQLDAAATDYAHALAIARKHPEHRPLHAEMLNRYAALLKTMRRDREAKELAVEARSFRTK